MIPATSRMRRSKRAVSPLIATVLLIAFAVALGAVVMNWGRGYVEDTATMARERSDTEVTCASDVNIDIVEIDGVPQVCYNATPDPDRLEFIIENKKAKTVEKIEVRIIGTSSRVPETKDLGYESNLTVNAAKLLNMTFDGSKIGAPQQVKFTPYIKVGANEIACPSSAEIATNIKTCASIY